MKFRSFLKGPHNLSIARVMEVDDDGNSETLGYEVYEGTNRIGGSGLMLLANAVGVVRRRSQALQQHNSDEEEFDDDGPGADGP